MFGLKSLRRLLGCKEERYKALLDSQKEKTILFEEAYIKQKERYDCMNSITIDLIKLLVKDDDPEQDVNPQEEIIALLQKGLYDNTQKRDEETMVESSADRIPGNSEFKSSLPPGA